MEKTIIISGKSYTANIEVVRESDELKARAAREQLSEYGAYLAEKLRGRGKDGRREASAVL